MHADPAAHDRERDDLDAVVLDGLRPLAAALAGVFSLFVVLHAFDLILPQGPSLRIAFMDGCIGVAFGVLWVVLDRGKLPSRWVHPVVFALLGLILVDALLLMVLTGAPRFTSHLVVLLLGAGAFMLSTRWLAATLVLAVAAWLPVVARLAAGKELYQYVGLVFAAAVAAAAIHAARLRSYRRILRQQRVDRLRQQELLRALERSERRFRKIVEGAGDGIALIDDDGSFSYVNPRIEEILGHKKRLIGRPLLDIVHPDDRDEVRRKFEGRRSGAGERYECRLIHRDGSTLWCQVRASPLFDDSGRFEGSLGLVTDISERRRIQQAADDERKRLVAIVEHLPEAVLVLDPAHRILFVNPAAVEHLPHLTAARLGETVSTLGGRPLEDPSGDPPREGAGTPWRSRERGSASISSPRPIWTEEGGRGARSSSCATSPRSVRSGGASRPRNGSLPSDSWLRASRTTSTTSCRPSRCPASWSRRRAPSRTNT